MGQSSGIFSTLRMLSDWGTLPDAERGTYFAELLTMGWYELLCCPMIMGAMVVVFEPLQRSGGKPVYKIKARLSYSEHVPRFQVNVVAEDGSNTNWVVGNLEKQETHLRTKPGEFVRVQVWKLMTNSMDISEGKSCLYGTSAFPSSTDIKILHMAITTQAKADLEDPGPNTDPTGEPLSPKINASSERWVQTVTVDDPKYEFQACTLRTDRSSGPQPQLNDIDILKVWHKGRKVAIARKQRFAGAWGVAEQPYLGVQIRPGENEARHEQGNTNGLFLDTSSLMMLLMCVAWSEETMLSEQDMTSRFSKAMRVQPGLPGSASQLGLSVAWDLDDVKRKLKHRPFTKFYDWDAQYPAQIEPSESEKLIADGTGAGDEMNVANTASVW
mmetsp:Transcript_140050/g.364020  ORF Transcript_140050/g.364020 Transcript_140050/m.364020 type:complete len:385 (-) Transcript_140050:76-1230(-)